MVSPNNKNYKYLYHVICNESIKKSMKQVKVTRQKIYKNKFSA